MENNDSDFEKDLKKVFRRELRDSLKGEMQQLEEDLPAVSTKRKVFPLKTILAIAASVLLLGSLFWMNNSEASPEQLFVDNFEIYENFARPTTRNAPAKTFAEQAYLAYDQGNFEKAVELFPKIEDKDRLLEDKFYLALSNLALNHTKSAIAQLQEIQSKEYKKIAMWYLALAFLQENNLELAEEQLNLIIADNNHPYLNEAKQLLTKVMR